MQNSDKNVIQPKLSCTADENVKGTNPLENALIILYNVHLCTFYHIMNEKFQCQVFILEKWKRISLKGLKRECL